MKLVTLTGQVIFSATFEFDEKELKEVKDEQDLYRRKLLRTTVGELTQGHNTGLYNFTVNTMDFEVPKPEESTTK